MQSLPVRLLSPGMVAAKPILSEKGMVLVAEGTELTEALIARLGRMEVGKVAVEGHPVELPGESSKSLDERLAELDLAFSRVENDPVMMELKGIYAEFAENPPELADDEDTQESEGHVQGEA